MAGLYLPRAEGGRGLVCLEHAWETETLAAEIYLHNNSDPQVKQAMCHMVQVAKGNQNGLVSHAKWIGEKYGYTNLLPTYGDEINPTKTINLLRNKQKRSLREEREGKVIHGAFAWETRKPECDKAETLTWLRNGCFKAKTEGLIAASQDGVIHTAAYCHRILGENCSPICRECGGAVETLGHILSACESYKWSLYKTRHDGILNVLVRAAAEELKIQIPENRWDNNQRIKSAIYGGERAVFQVDQCFQTKGRIEARRPDGQNGKR